MRGVTFSATGPTPLTPLRTTTSGRPARRYRPGGRWRRPMRTSRPRTTLAARRLMAVRCCRQLTPPHTTTTTTTHTHTRPKEYTFGASVQKLFGSLFCLRSHTAAAVPFVCNDATMQRRRHARRREQTLERSDRRLLQGPRAVLRRPGEELYICALCSRKF
eukprot:COSAG06_NODE_2367_length_7000_cov_16.568179_4_plen_161_part_00